MIARGKNASDLFPAVVKNVASKNIEVCDELLSPHLSFSSACMSNVTRKVHFSIKATAYLQVMHDLVQPPLGFCFIQPEQNSYFLSFFLRFLSLIFICCLQIYKSENNKTNLDNLI